MELKVIGVHLTQANRSCLILAERGGAYTWADGQGPN